MVALAIDPIPETLKPLDPRALHFSIRGNASEEESVLTQIHGRGEGRKLDAKMPQNS